MSAPPNSVLIKEGRTDLFVPQAHSESGPGKRVGRVFFNGQMAFNRDVSVMYFQAVGPMKSALDGMASTGARSVRIANEARTDIEITVNDKDEEACLYIETNIALTGVQNCSVNREDLRCLLTHQVYDYIDIDPFGTPVPFLQSVMQGARRKGRLGVTATDTAPLAGTYPRKCLRRYGARSTRSPFGHETGLRILIGHLAREAAKEDKGIRCQLCFYADHYFRIYLQLMESGREADRSLEQLGFLDYDKGTGRRVTSGEPSSKWSIGPLWLGDLFDKDLLASMNVSEGLAEKERCEKYLSLWRMELEVPFYYENDELASMLRTSPPRMDKVMEKVGEVGRIARTHFSPTAFKTDLPLEELIPLFKEAC